ncbi:DNA repair and recombination protein RAD54B-like [Watersipora subatra]|uniref:DNA repair and recombination protein RAD54B-like n=1 Tax=Watersipora subatra TaxID=2589382 RepID=UPI00355C10A7
MKRSAAPSKNNEQLKKIAKFNPPYHIQKTLKSASTNADSSKDTGKFEFLKSDKSLNIQNNVQNVGVMQNPHTPKSCLSNRSACSEMPVTSLSDGISATKTSSVPKQHKLAKFCSPLRQRYVNESSSDKGQYTLTGSDSVKHYFKVVWCKRSTKKHKNWEGDAILVATGRNVSLLDTDGKEIGKAGGYKHAELSNLKEGETLLVGGKEIEVMEDISKENFLSGSCFAGKNERIPTISKSQALPKRTVTGASLFLSNVKASDCSITTHKPRFDPTLSTAVVLSRPPASLVPKGATVVDVVVDPHVSRNLRPHQKEGINFLYKCVMGYAGNGGFGAILADEMGLGKTLQAIALIWTLLKQNPIHHKPVLRRALIVTPGSLVNNWMKEFKKWLGKERLNVFAVSSDKKAEEFKNACVYPVMIVSYEMFVRYCDVIKQSNFDLIVCDEGHRLKNSAIKTTSFLQSLSTSRRVVITGTPIQNDLKEFFTLVNFCNPGLLGNQLSFRKVYEDPILRSKQPDCALEEKKIGEERAKELNRITSSFILRRTGDVNQQYLLSKTEYVVFCKPSQMQVDLYRKMVSSSQVTALLGCSGDGSAHLTCINSLKQICNHPCLVTQIPDAKEPPPAEIQIDVSASGKLKVLSKLLDNLLVAQCAERVVLVSNYTKMLDVLEGLCKQSRYKFLRLDGQTPVQKRQQLVDKFNSSFSDCNIFLLSSKAGGVGLNLIGANRLVLYDIDWNPANDLQAMSRVWRDGQKKPVYIYRLLTTGTIEEKIYQRQVSKQTLGNSVIDSFKEAEVKFSQSELKDLFTFQPHTACDTHQMLKCNCQEDSAAPILHKQLDSKRNTEQLGMSELKTWNHLPPSDIPSKVEDSLVHTATEGISFLFASSIIKNDQNGVTT